MTHFSRLRQLLLLQPKFLSSQPRPLRSPPPTFLRSVMGSSSSFSSSSSKLLFRQLFENESSTFTYLLADVSHPDKPALLIDPVDKTVDRDLKLIDELGLKLIYAMNTHVHADHVTGTGLLKVCFLLLDVICLYFHGFGLNRRFSDLSLFAPHRRSSRV